jgi:prephenate dehydrogenase
VIGVARRQWSVDQALQRRWIDEGTLDLREGVTGADVVILATPVRTIIRLIPRVGPWVRQGCVLMDLGSTKREVVVAMETLPPHVDAVGGHPMCGKESSGLDAAEPGLYEGATFALTPLPRTSASALSLSQELVHAVGARALLLGAERHDWLVGAVSHLPYCLAAALVGVAEAVAKRDDGVWELAASGFRDTSRLAASDVAMTRDILLTNGEVVSRLLRCYRSQIDRWLVALETGDDDELERMMTAVCSRRSGLFGHNATGQEVEG